MAMPNSVNIGVEGLGLLGWEHIPRYESNEITFRSDVVDAFQSVSLTQWQCQTGVEGLGNVLHHASTWIKKKFSLRIKIRSLSGLIRCKLVERGTRIRDFRLLGWENIPRYESNEITFRSDVVGAFQSASLTQWQCQTASILGWRDSGF